MESWEPPVYNICVDSLGCPGLQQSKDYVWTTHTYKYGWHVTTSSRCIKMKPKYVTMIWGLPSCLESVLWLSGSTAVVLSTLPNRKQSSAVILAQAACNMGEKFWAILQLATRGWSSCFGPLGIVYLYSNLFFLPPPLSFSLLYPSHPFASASLKPTDAQSDARSFLTEEMISGQSCHVSQNEQIIRRCHFSFQIIFTINHSVYQISHIND